MRRSDLLINQIRRATENVEFSDSTGISNEEFLQYLNDAQNRIQSLIVQKNPEVFLKEKIIPAVRSQEAYSLPSDIYIGSMVRMVDYASTGLATDYQQLKQGRLMERLGGISSSPSFYIRRGSQILLQPSPDDASGSIRVTYVKQLPKIDLRRGKVLSATLGAGNTITTLTLDSTEAIDEVELEEELVLTVVDKNGVAKMKGITFTDINSTSGVVSVDASFVYEDGESISAGDYVVRGANSTTQSELPEACERYLIEYSNFRILNRDSNSDQAGQSPLLQSIEGEIVGLYAEPDQDVDYVSILDNQYIEGDDFRV